MALVDCTPEVPEVALPSDVQTYLEDADQTIYEFQSGVLYQPAGGFLASDFPLAYAVLRRLKGMGAGRRFCEWGAGFGVVAGLAAFQGFEACGIEAQEELVRRGSELQARHDLHVELAYGTIVATEHDGALTAGEPTFLDMQAPDGHEALGRDPDEFDVVYVYPWPNESELIEQLFELQAREGAYLVTYREAEDLVVLQKQS